MKRFFTTSEQLTNNFIDGEEFQHLKNVLRMQEGDRFIAFCNNEFDYECTITEIKKDKVFAEVHKCKTRN